MKKKITYEDIIKQLKKLSRCSVNDAVKLAFLETEPDPETIDKLNLDLITELKRNSKGSVEIKLLNRLEIIKFLASLLGDGDGGDDGESLRDFMEALSDAVGESGETDEV